jgi:hypothetical protein
LLLSYLFIYSADASPVDGKDGVLHLGIPDDVDVCIEFKDWLFALEGAQEMTDRWWFYNHEDVGREERCWHTSFQSLLVKAKSGPKKERNGKGKPNGKLKYPVELVTVRNSPPPLLYLMRVIPACYCLDTYLLSCSFIFSGSLLEDL